MIGIERTARTPAFAAIGLALSLSACGGTDRGYATAAQATAAGTAVNGMRLLLEPVCPVSGTATKAGESALAGTIIASLLVAAVDVGVKSLGAALAEAGSDKTAYFPARRSFDFYNLPAGGDADPKKNAAAVQMNPSNACLILYMPDSPARDISNWQTSTIRTAFAKLKINQVPAFYLEASFEVSSDTGHFRLAPKAFLYGGNLLDSRWRSAKRDIVVTFDWTKPGGEPGKSIAADRLTFMQVTPDPDRILRDTDLAVGTMSYLPLPAIDGKSMDILTARRTAIEEFVTISAPADGQLSREKVALTRAQDALANAAWKPEERSLQIAVRNGLRAVQAREAELKLKGLKDRISTFKEIDIVPMNLQVTVAETAEGSALLKKMGEILAGASPAITAATTAAVKDRFDPATREKAAQDAINATNQTELAILNAEKSVSTAQLQLANLPAGASAEARAVAEADLRIARFNANVAYQAAGRGIPYPDARP